jgi:taurine transport system substrate-binding protein
LTRSATLGTYLRVYTQKFELNYCQLPINNLEYHVSLKRILKYFVIISFLSLAVSACAPGEKTNPDPEGAQETGDTQPTVTVGYQGMLNPWKAAIESKRFSQVTGRDIAWRKFNSGSEVITAMASGDVDLAVAGSSPIATAMSRGLELELVWILEAIEANEALIARQGSGIKTLQDLKGKTVGVPFASTTHYHLLFALEHNNIDTKDLTVLNLQPDAIAASWAQDRIDAAFIWSPVLDQLKANGTVIVSSGELAKLGRPTFDGLIAQQEFAQKNPEFMAQFIGVIAAADADYRDHADAWTADAPQVQAIAKVTGAKAADVTQVLSQYAFPDLNQQVSSQWLGGDKDHGAAKALADTSQFLKAEQKISEVLPDYSRYVNASYAQAALEASAVAATSP